MSQNVDYDYAMADMSFFQLLHDERYHRDVYNLPLIQRINHLKNHISKYHATILRKAENGGDPTKEIVDAGIVCVSALTTLGYSGYSNESLGDWWCSKSIIRDEDITHSLGGIAKLLEGHDHTESLRYIPELTNDFENLFVKFLSMFYQIHKQGFLKHYVERLYQIQRKNPLHYKIVGHFGPIRLKDNIGESWLVDVLNGDNI